MTNQTKTPGAMVLVPIDPASNLEIGWAYLDAAREAQPEKDWSFSHAGYRAMIAAAKQPPASRSFNGNPEQTLSNEIAISEPVNEEGEPTRYIINQHQLDRIRAIEYAMTEQPPAVGGESGIFKLQEYALEDLDSCGEMWMVPQNNPSCTLPCIRDPGPWVLSAHIAPLLAEIERLKADRDRLKIMSGFSKAD